MTNRSRNHLSSKYVVFAIEMYRCGAMRFTLMTIMFDLSLILQLFLQHAVITFDAIFMFARLLIFLRAKLKQNTISNVISSFCQL